jgi:hypothetical protein
MRRMVLSTSVLLTLGLLLCQAQVTPVVAKRRVVEDVLDSEGRVVSHSEMLGRYLRNSEGSTVTQILSSGGGKTAIHSGQLEDYRRHKIYSLNYEKHEAVELVGLPDGPHPEYLANAGSALGEETVNGFPCLIHSVYVKIDGRKKQIGKTYDSAGYGLRIKEDAVIEPPGGPRTHLVEELYDVSFVEPDPTEFALEKFSFLEKGPAACAKPGAAPPLESLK